MGTAGKIQLQWKRRRTLEKEQIKDLVKLVNPSKEEKRTKHRNRTTIPIKARSGSLLRER
ncbi:hypothetical protein CR513_38184, partial [Mucuna pruriens]